MTSTQWDRSLVLDAVWATEAAAIAAWKLAGRGDEKAADQAAVDALRNALNDLDIDGLIVIGEGERDEAPMLYIGEKVGKGEGPRIDIALDPLEGTTLTAKAMANALAVMAWAPAGTLLNAPDTYMDKIAIGPGFPQGIIDLDASPADNVRALAKAKGVAASDITACVLDRPRHAEIIASLREVGARVHLITDGDVAGVINTADPDTGVDIYIGQGGAPEGVLACAALKCVGGQFQGRLVFRNADERGRAERLGITDFDKKYDLHEMVRGPAIFAATGVTKGALLDGVRFEGGFVHTHSLVMDSSTGTVRQVRMKRTA
jgi:fructose-1,6-bisphosphatase II / sedoheptulose-1,7-bisphosphatase